MPRSRIFLNSLALGAATAVTFAGGAAPAVAAHGVAHAQVQTVRPVPASIGHLMAQTLSFPPTNTFCLQNFGIHCYGPAQYANAYRLAKLFGSGATGKGHTIAIVDSFGSPTIVNDLHVFDQTFGLSDPHVQIIQPAGPVPAFDNTDPDMLGWATETTLDVEYAHVFAPDAKILLVETLPRRTTSSTTTSPT
jgi:subtilase family serine protease